MSSSEGGASWEDEEEEEEEDEEEEEGQADESPTVIARGYLGNTMDLLVKAAVENGDANKVRELLTSGLGPPGSQQGSRAAFKLLSIAAIKSRPDIMKLLVGGGCDVNQVSSDGRTSLHYAVWNGHAEMVEVLLRAGCDPTLHERYGDTLLMIAANHGHLHILRLLVAAGCDPRESNSSCDTALHYACRNGHRACVRWLVDTGAHLDVPNSWGYTPLTLAVSQEHAPIAQYLIAQGCQVNCTDKANRTPLHYAARRDMVDSVRLLLTRGAHPDIKDQHNNSPLIEAVFHNHIRVVHLLTQYNCNVHRHGNCSVLTTGTIAPAAIALLRHNFKIVEILYNAGSDLRTDLMNIKMFTSLTQLYGYLQNTEFKHWLHDVMSNPRPLQDLCRICLRSQLGNEVQTKIPQLPVPPKLIPFLSLSPIP